MLVVHFSHVLPTLCPRRHLHALEQVSVSSWLDRRRLPRRYITSDMDSNEDFLSFEYIIYMMSLTYIVVLSFSVYVISIFISIHLAYFLHFIFPCLSLSLSGV